jgi:hypothetical protein
VAAVGAYPGGIFGRFTDRELYSALLAGNREPFIEVVWELADSFERLGVEIVASDACEGYNPVHDACRWMVDAAVALVRARGSGDPLSYDFTLIGPPDECPTELRPWRRSLSLDEEAFSRKLEAAYAYPELAAEMEAVFRGVGVDAFRHEFLRPAHRTTAVNDSLRPRPQYEDFGERRVGDGLYDEVIRYREHMQPLAAALYGLVDDAALPATAASCRF